MNLIDISCTLAEAVDALHFSPPVGYAYNPLDYAREPHEEYLRRYGEGRREVFMLGMNPGPYGMAQTGVPFGDVVMVREWLGIDGSVGHPPREHPRRIVQGFAVTRREPSGTRLWGWARARWQTPDAFFRRFYVANYCPLLFLSEAGENLTPDKLTAADRTALYAACDAALTRTIELQQPRYAIGIGNFATKRLQSALPGSNLIFGTIPHPSPANPKANSGWAEQVDTVMKELGVME